MKRRRFLGPEVETAMTEATSGPFAARPTNSVVGVLLRPRKRATPVEVSALRLASRFSRKRPTLHQAARLLRTLGTPTAQTRQLTQARLPARRRHGGLVVFVDGHLYGAGSHADVSGYKAVFVGRLVVQSAPNDVLCDAEYVACGIDETVTALGETAQVTSLRNTHYLERDSNPACNTSFR